MIGMRLHSMRALHRTLEAPDAHTRLDTAVRAAYAMPQEIQA